MFTRLLILVLLVCRVSATPVILTQANGDPRALRTVAPDTYELQSARGISLYANSAAPVPDGPLVLEFDYFCLGGVKRFALLPGPPFEAESARWSAPLDHSETWTPHRIRLAHRENPLPADWKRLRLDLPILQETTLRIRKIRLRPERPNEFDPPRASSAETTATLGAYLESPHKARIRHISLTADSVVITGNTGSLRDRLAVAEVPIEKLRSDPRRFADYHPLTPGEDGQFSITLPRMVQKEGRELDRLTSKWQLVTVSAAGLAPVSHARFPDQVACRSPQLPPARPKSKKGLGGWSAHRKPAGDLAALGIASVTVNINVESVISLTPTADSFPIQWQGRTYHANRRALEKYDQTLREASRNGCMVSAILLIANPARSHSQTVKMLGHPDAVEAGKYAMPNVTSSEGINLYGAVLNLMAERWSRPDGKFGRVHHWIVHNEVDAGWTWTNCGRKELLPFVDLYLRSLRMVHLITSQYDPHARPFVSLTHHWARTVRPEYHPSRDILQSLVRLTAAEGDFPWALAYHPYPQSLRNPRTWEDHEASNNFDTPKITPHNIEILDLWMRTPSMLYQGTELRPIHLSENGFNSPDYSAQSLRDQAAAMAYAWKKIAPLDSIHAWHYHNWIDNRQEGGLRLGLRKFPDHKPDPLGPKPIWHLYRVLATAQESEALQPYLRYINTP